ncbi:MAG: ATP-binding protein, partial [Candidatus Omnitrophica bacterium]|nr:ATP-binding protein [Candidatus Omnitrophota bacterium]
SGHTLEVLITDRYGALVASTRRTHDFYYANKEWWQAAFEGGAGKIFIGDVIFDESLNVWAVPFVVPIKNEFGEVTGIWRSLVDISIFFAPLEDFKIGKAGYSALVDDKSYLIYYAGAKPFANKFCEYKYLQKALANSNRWTVMDGIYGHAGAMFMASAQVTNPLLLKKGINWMVFVVQDEKNLSSALNDFIFKLLLWAIAIVVLAILAARGVFYGIFKAPINKIREGMEYVANGKLDHRVDLKTGDEIGRLASSFNAMVEDLKSSTIPVARLDSEVAERKKTQAALARISEELQRVLNALTEMVFIIDTNFNITTVNKAFLEATGLLKSEDIIGKKCFDVPFPENLIDRQALNRKGIHTEEIHDPATGNYFLLTVAPIFNELGDLLSVVHVIKNISDIKKTASELEKKSGEVKRINRLESDLIAIITWLRGPISLVEESMKTLVAGLPPAVNEKHQKAIVMAEASIKKAHKVMDDLIDVGMIEEGRVELKSEPANMRSIIKKVIFDFESRIRKNGLDLKLDIPQQNVEVYVDVNQITRVFNYLIENAINFTERGYVEISVKELANTVECGVADTGVGIPAEDLPKVFDRLRSTGRVQELGGKGLGLELFIVKGILEKHGGKIWVESAVGKGTKFTFVLPKYRKV